MSTSSKVKPIHCLGLVPDLKVCYPAAAVCVECPFTCATTLCCIMLRSFLVVDLASPIQVGRYAIVIFTVVGPPIPSRPHSSTFTMLDRQYNRKYALTDVGYYLTRTIISTSQAACIGRLMLPTAARACLPASPNRFPNSSEAPLMTLG